MREMLPAGENSAEQDGGVDGGDFRIPNSLASINIAEVIEEAPMVGQFLPQETQGIESARFGRPTQNIFAFFSDAQSSQPEARCRNASDFVCDGIASVASVQYEPCFRVCLVPKVSETGLLQSVQKPIIAGGEILAGRGRHRGGDLFAPRRQFRKRARPQDRDAGSHMSNLL